MARAWRGYALTYIAISLTQLLDNLVLASRARAGGPGQGSVQIQTSATLGLLAPKEEKMFVRLKIEDTREGLVATISQREDDGKITGRPSIFLVGGKDEAKQKARAVARALGLKTYRVLDRTSSRMSPPIHPA